MDETDWAVLTGQLRTLGAAIGGALVTQGIVSQSTMVAALGIITAIIPFVLSAVSKYRQRDKAKVRDAVLVNIGIVKADSTLGPTPLVTPAKAAALIEEIAPIIPVVVPPVVQLTQGDSK